MQVSLEFLEAVEKCMIGRAGVRRRSETIAEVFDFGQQYSGSFVLLGHHLNWIDDRSKAALGLRAALG